MIKFYCDRCGKELPKDKNYGYLRHKEYYRLTIGGLPLYKKDGDREISLCESCSNSFIKWFGGYKND